MGVYEGTEKYRLSRLRDSTLLFVDDVEAADPHLAFRTTLLEVSVGFGELEGIE